MVELNQKRPIRAHLIVFAFAILAFLLCSAHAFASEEDTYADKAAPGIEQAAQLSNDGGRENQDMVNASPADSESKTDAEAAKEGAESNSEAGKAAENREPVMNPPSVKGNADPAKPPIEDGEYLIYTTLNDFKVVDVNAGRNANMTNVQIYDVNLTGAQKFRFIYNKEGG